MLAGAAVRNAVAAVVICMSMLAQADRAKAQIKALAVLNVYAFSINGALVCTEAAQLQVLQRLRYSLRRQPGRQITRLQKKHFFIGEGWCGVTQASPTLLTSTRGRSLTNSAYDHRGISPVGWSLTVGRTRLSSSSLDQRPALATASDLHQLWRSIAGHIRCFAGRRVRGRRR